MTILTAAMVDASFILGLALGATVLLKHHSAALRHWVIAAAIGCAMLMPALELLLPAWRLPVDGSRWTTAVVSSGVLGRSEAIAADPSGAPTARVSRLAEGYAAVAAAIVSTPGIALATAWALGVAVALSLLGIGLLRVRRLALSAHRVEDPAWLALAAGIARAQGVRRPILLLRSAHPAMVVTWGFLRPRVLLPATAREWSLDRLRIVLCHEFAHVRRHDWAIQIAAAVAQAIYWFNPLAWMAGAVLRRESERACDDVVLASGIPGPDYATHLLAVARDAVHARTWPAAAMAQPSSLEGRVRAMLNTTIDRTPVTRRARAAAAALVALLTIGVAAAAFPNDVTAQGGIGTIKATLYDQAGGLLPSAEVRVLHVDSGRTLETTTDRNGSVALENVPTGVYELTMGRLPGFSTVRSTVDLRAGDVLQRNVVLPLGSIEETITIIGPREPGAPSARPTTPTFRPAREIPPPRPGTAAGGIGGNIRQPRKLVDKKPIFPAELGGSSGTVVLQGRIGIDGYLVDLKDISQTQPQPALVESLRAAVSLWEFEPTLLNGTPVDTNITITGRFQSAK